MSSSPLSSSAGDDSVIDDGNAVAATGGGGGAVCSCVAGRGATLSNWEGRINVGNNREASEALSSSLEREQMRPREEQQQQQLTAHENGNGNDNDNDNGNGSETATMRKEQSFTSTTTATTTASTPPIPIAKARHPPMARDANEQHFINDHRRHRHNASDELNGTERGGGGGAGGEERLNTATASINTPARTRKTLSGSRVLLSRHYSTSPTRGETSPFTSQSQPTFRQRSMSTGLWWGTDHLNRASSSRMGPFSRQNTLGSSLLLGDSMTEVVLEDLQGESEPTSAILDYCKRKFLRPYVILLSVASLSPIPTDTTTWRTCCSYFQALLLGLLLTLAYLLQYFCSYRGDRGFANYRKVFPTYGHWGKTEPGVHTVGELIFGYVIPNVLHLCGYISAVIVAKMIDQEQLQNLVERVFLMTMKPRHLCRTLWIYVACGFIMLCLQSAYVAPAVWMQAEIVQTRWLKDSLQDLQTVTKVALLFGIFLQDFIEIIILTSYCVECYLLRVHLSTLSHKLLMHTIESFDWMREILEFRKLLDHLNQRVALPICFFIVMNLAYAFAGVVYFFNDFDFHYSAMKVVILNIINILLWLVMGLVPFFQAASVTRLCQIAQATGHQIRVRPFVYHNTSAEDLNSTLLFASSLDMSAKLFHMPIMPNYLCFAILVVSVVILTLGMCFNLSVLGDI